jgi:hypothetical protein
MENFIFHFPHIVEMKIFQLPKKKKRGNLEHNAFIEFQPHEKFLRCATKFIFYFSLSARFSCVAE